MLHDEANILFHLNFTLSIDLWVDYAISSKKEHCLSHIFTVHDHSFLICFLYF